ncbi:hypothetical protein V8C86DRAFT_2437757 [Haematococcus lacustris]
MAPGPPSRALPMLLGVDAVVEARSPAVDSRRLVGTRTWLLPAHDRTQITLTSHSDSTHAAAHHCCIHHWHTSEQLRSVAAMAATASDAVLRTPAGKAASAAAAALQDAAMAAMTRSTAGVATQWARDQNGRLIRSEVEEGKDEGTDIGPTKTELFADVWQAEKSGQTRTCLKARKLCECDGKSDALSWPLGTSSTSETAAQLGALAASAICKGPALLADGARTVKTRPCSTVRMSRAQPQTLAASTQQQLTVDSPKSTPGGQHVVNQRAVEHHRYAKLSLAAGRPAQALDILRRGLAEFPNDRHMLSLAASLERRAGRYHTARHLLQHGLQHHPKHVAFIVALAQLQAQCGHLEEAQLLLAKALELNPRNAAVYQLWATMDLAAGNHSAARAHFNTAISKDPSMPHTWCAWARMEAGLGRHEQARKLFAQGAKACGPHAPLLHVRSLGGAWASFELELGAIASARSLLLKALLLGHVEWRSGRSASARLVWRRGNSTRWGPSSSLLCYWAKQELRLRNTEAARQLLAEARAADPGNASGVLMAAVMEDRAGRLTRRGRRQEAQALLHLLEKWHPGNGHVCHSLGLMSQQEGRLDQAQACFAQGTASSSLAGCLLCWEALAELHYFQVLAAALERWLTCMLRNVRVMGACCPDVRAAGVVRAQGKVDVARRTFQAGASTLTAKSPQLPHGLSLMPPPSGSASSPSGPQLPASFPSGLLPASLSSDQLPDSFPGVSGRYLRHWALMEKKAGGREAALKLFTAAAQKDPLSLLPVGVVPRGGHTFLDMAIGIQHKPLAPTLASCTAAIFERRCERWAQAEQAFQRAADLAPYNYTIWAKYTPPLPCHALLLCARYAYANMLWRKKGALAQARAVLQHATTTCPHAAPLWLEWALLEWQGAGQPAAALQLLQCGSGVPDRWQHPPLYEAWAQLAKEMGAGEQRVAMLLAKAEAYSIRALPRDGMTQS